jgi:hypothetical protein
MAEFKLERFKYIWKGEWQPNVVYNRDDIVRLGGKSYVCLIQHTSDADFNTDLNAILQGSNPPQPAPRWTVMTSSQTFSGDWQTSNQYQIGDIVLFDGSLWAANVGHVSTDFASDYSKWDIFADAIKFTVNWQSGRGYGKGAIVKYNGIVYKCKTPHTSQSLLEDDQNKWTVFHNGIEYRGSYAPSELTTITYRKNDLVKYGGTIWKCTETHIDTGFFDETKFEIELPGTQFDEVWNEETSYQAGDVVRYGGFVYFATANSLNSVPSATENWRLLSRSYNYRGQWNQTVTYLTGDVVRRGGELWLALVDVDGVPVEDGSTAITTDYLDPDKWEKLNTSKRWSGEWALNIEYLVGDVVYYYGTAYTCTYQHTSEDRYRPDNGSGWDYWTIQSEAASPAGMGLLGDLLTWNAQRDGSSIGVTAVPIGNEKELLSVNDSNDVIWRNTDISELVIWVSQNGVDADGRGFNPYYPVRSIRYATQLAEDRDDLTVPCKIKVATGRYYEECPMIVAKNTAVVGDELRATTIEANPPKADYVEDDYNYMILANAHINTLIPSILTNQAAAKTEGNIKEQVIDTEIESTIDIAAMVSDKIVTINQYLTYNLGNGLQSPVVTGSLVAQTLPEYTNAVQILKNNGDFLAHEAVAFLQAEYPEYTNIDTDWIKRFVRDFIRAAYLDIKFEGTYYSVMAARRFYNSIVGSQLEDMFYVRDATGIRNCTVEGLRGALNPQGVFDLYRRPTGGAYVSLDPGFGVDDERTWILTRSPYIQGVTTIGTACIGQKVDGALHNGGNKSITSNDFTQVLSDGVGAWVLNNARAELVSVFTYYCAVGYLAENGGVIRATNGNNSYGLYGAVSDGIDPSETPATATVDNRNNEAIVSAAFAGEVTDEIQVFEFSHCGEQYTTATSSVIGAGNFASTIFDDIRNGALYQARLVNPGDSASVGGSGHLKVANNAQSGTATTITLATNDPNLPSDYIGMRILLTSGAGTGQFGIIGAYNDTTKVAQIFRETDQEVTAGNFVIGQRYRIETLGTTDFALIGAESNRVATIFTATGEGLGTGTAILLEAGWDHLIPGTTIQSTLTTNAQYSIESRLHVSHPGFVATVQNQPNTRDFKDIVWGPNTRTYNGIDFGQGTGEVIDTVITNAIFRVQVLGREYVVTNIVAGSGYAVGDTATILGSELGGVDDDNDVVITVTEVSNDSTNSIVSFTSTGTPNVGTWLAIAQPNYFIHSGDGETWVESTLPEVGEWKKLAAGDNKFVAMRSNSGSVALSSDGENWSLRALPISANWSDIVYGNGVFVMIAEGSQDYVYSVNGSSWVQGQLPVGDDSTGDQWQTITYGGGRFIALSGSQTKDVAYSSDGVTWSVFSNALPAGNYSWSDLAYGNNRFLAIDRFTGTAVYSLTRGRTWQTAPLPTLDDSTPLNWNAIKYDQGLFMLVGDTGDRDIAGDTTTGPLGFIWVSEDGIRWRRRGVSTQEWRSIAYGNPNGERYWVAISQRSGSNGGIEKIITGARAKLRASTASGIFNDLRITDPGSGYDPLDPPVVTVFDSNATSDVFTSNRIGNGVLAQPSFVNRGLGYRTSSTTVTISGDGYADIIPESTFLDVEGLVRYPGPGAQVRITGIQDDDDEDLQQIFTVVVITPLGDDGSGNGTLSARFQINPRLENKDSLAHGTALNIRERYSQCRITGHDFLDIGTGNFEQTNYPELYAGGAFFVALPENEVYEETGGRVFYTSSDQDGNFRAGELFSVEQATGIVTISAEFFDLDGLSELSLGGVRLGGSGTVVREFSTDPKFTEDSNNIVPTQRAIATFLANRLSEGGSELQTNTLIAGVTVLGSFENVIRTLTGIELVFPRRMNFDGQDDFGSPTSLSGSILAQNMFLRPEELNNGIF